MLTGELLARPPDRYERLDDLSFYLPLRYAQLLSDTWVTEAVKPVHEEHLPGQPWHSGDRTFDRQNFGARDVNHGF